MVMKKTDTLIVVDVYTVRLICYMNNKRSRRKICNLRKICKYYKQFIII